jgi:hypothetical protein
VSRLPDAAWEAIRRGTVREAQAALEAARRAGGEGGPLYHPARYEPDKSLIHVEEHLAQLCLHVDRWWDEVDVYQQWIFFDDRWAAAHPDLANSILRYTRCWDMLSPDGPNEED